MNRPGEFGFVAGKPSRRDVLRAGAGLCLATIAAGASAPTGDNAVILLLMVGGPSQLETFDPKPAAPADVRGPFGSIPTRTPGLRVSEHLPRIARRTDRVSVIRTLCHDAAPIHETGLQLLQTGGVSTTSEGRPNTGALVASTSPGSRSVPPFVQLPGRLEWMGVDIPRGDRAGLSDSDPESRRGFEIGRCPSDREPTDVRDRYGRTAFGDECRRACRLVESGARFVTVAMYPTVFGMQSWDCHGHGPFAGLKDYAETVLPTFDRAYSALLDDLTATGRIASTLVVAAGEFGRTPRLNSAGGRDHWPGCGIALLAGCGVPGGQVIGRSDRIGSEPADRPVAPEELVAAMYRVLAIESFAARAGAGLPVGPPEELFG